jgi:hypothetical protein
MALHVSITRTGTACIEQDIQTFKQPQQRKGVTQKIQYKTINFNDN